MPDILSYPTMLLVLRQELGFSFVIVFLRRQDESEEALTVGQKLFSRFSDTIGVQTRTKIKILDRSCYPKRNDREWKEKVKKQRGEKKNDTTDIGDPEQSSGQKIKTVDEVSFDSIHEARHV